MKIYLEWDEIKFLVENLSREIINYSPDCIIAVAMGGWAPARLLKNHYKCEYYSIGCTYYENNQKTDQVKIIQDLSNVDIKGKRVLILDEVADSGDTLHRVYEYVKSLGPQELKTAVLHTKSCSGFTPDFTAENVGNEWLVYPWE